MSFIIKQRTNNIDKIDELWCEKWMEFIIKNQLHLTRGEWFHISSNKNLTLEFITNHMEYPWDWHGISCNINLTMEFIEQYPDKKWEWFFISMNNPRIMEMVTKYVDKPWSWSGIY